MAIWHIFSESKYSTQHWYQYRFRCIAKKTQLPPEKKYLSVTLTFQRFIVAELGVRQLPVTEHLPHQHAVGPHVGLGGEVILEYRLGREPAQRDPRLPVVVVLAGQRHAGGGDVQVSLRGQRDPSVWFCGKVGQTCCRHPCWGWATTPWRASGRWWGSCARPGLCAQSGGWTSAPSREPPGHRWKPGGGGERQWYSSCQVTEDTDIVTTVAAAVCYPTVLVTPPRDFLGSYSIHWDPSSQKHLIKKNKKHLNSIW